MYCIRIADVCIVSALRVFVFSSTCIAVVNVCTYGIFSFQVFVLHIACIFTADVWVTHTFALFPHVAHTRLVYTRLSCTTIDRTNISRVTRMRTSHTNIALLIEHKWHHCPRRVSDLASRVILCNRFGLVQLQYYTAEWEPAMVWHFWDKQESSHFFLWYPGR